MNCRFIKFTKKGKHLSCGDMNIRERQATITKQDFPNYKMIDIYTDIDNNAIRIVEGNTYNLGQTKRDNGYTYKYFYSALLVENNVVKKGKYKYIGNGIFKLIINQ